MFGKKKLEVWHEDLDSDMEEFAVWTTSYVNSLPDSAFLLPDKRALPFRDKSGKIDVAHLRNAAARVNQVNGITADQISSIKARIQRLLGKGGEKTSEGLLYSTEQFSLADDGLVWVHGFPYTTYKHPRYGEVKFTPDDAKQMLDNFNANVTRTDVPWNYDHGEDRAKGNKASGWVRKLDVREDGLYIGVEPTKEAMSELEDGQWKYSSIERRREWEDPETGDVHKNVLVGGAFTNTPFMRGIAPINFSEYVVREEQFNNEEDEVDLAELAKSVGLGADATEEQVFSRIKAIREDAEKFKENERESGPSTTGLEAFKETNPEVYAELMEARNDRRVRNAEKFADTLATDGKVLSPEWRGKITDAHIKMERQEIPLQEFSALVAQAATKGLVRLGVEKGGGTTKDNGDSDTTPDAKVQEFSDKARKYARENKVGMREAYGAVAADEPELAAAYAEYKDGRPVLVGSNED